MSINPTRPTVDPLAAARQQLDFEALAERAPSSKEILFKAQTIVPITPIRPWEKVAKGGSVLALAALLLFAPVVPRTASLALVNVQFEQQKFTRSEAQQLVYDVLRDLPDDVLLGAGFARALGQPQDNSQGRLQLNLIKFNETPERLAAIAGEVIEFKPKAGLPFYSSTTVARSSQWNSIPRAIAAAFRKDQPEPQPPLDQFRIVREILGNAELIGEGLRDRLMQQAGLELDHFGWTSALDQELPEGADFVLPAWPRWVSIGVVGYEYMMDGQQAGIRLNAEDYLAQLNLGLRGANLCRDAIQDCPLVVSVVAPGDAADPYLSALVQAQLAPELSKHQTITETQAEKLVEAACRKVLPQYELTVSVKAITQSGPGAGPAAYKATVRVGDDAGPRRWRVERDPLEQIENETEF